MLLLGHLAKVQGLKGEYLLHALTDDPERLPEIQGLVLAPPSVDLQRDGVLPAAARPVKVRGFRWHQDRPCVAFEGISDRNAAEPLKGWGLWMPESQARLEEGESFRHDWVGCEVFVGGRKVGEVLRLVPTPGGYDMVHMKDLRPGRTGLREVPYIKAWWTLDLANRHADLDPPEGLLDLGRVQE
ncbi:MAG: 16S rRNA processing protein RimM [Acidobacteria bacterium]|nr:16S rRNA processing protein RimM [Acidobacteriota bacterium]